MIESDFLAHLAAYPALTAIVGSAVYGGRVPTDAPIPAVAAFKLPGGDRTRSHSGDSGMETIIFQVDCWSPDYLTAIQTAAAIVAATESFRGTWGTTFVYSAFASPPYDIPYDPDAKEFRSIVEVTVTYKTR